MVHVEGDSGAQLIFRRLEGGAALGQRRAQDEGLRKHFAVLAAKGVVAARPLGGLHADRGGKAARFGQRIGNRCQLHEQIMGAADRPVALQRVLVVRIFPVGFHQPQRFDQAPAIGHRQVIGGEVPLFGPGDRALVGLHHRVPRLRTAHTGHTAAIQRDGIRINRAGFRFGGQTLGRRGDLGITVKPFAERLGDDRRGGGQKGDEDQCPHLNAPDRHCFRPCRQRAQTGSPRSAGGQACPQPSPAPDRSGCWPAAG